MLNVSQADPAAVKSALLENLEAWVPEEGDLKAYLDWVLERFYADYPDAARALILKLNVAAVEHRLLELVKLAIFKQACLEEVLEVEEVRNVVQGAFDSIEKERVSPEDEIPYGLAVRLLSESN